MIGFIKRIIKRKLIINYGFDLNKLKEAGAKVGENVHISAPIYFQGFEAKLIEIGDWVTIAPYVTFLWHDSSAVSVFIEERLSTKFGRIIIRNNVYIGARSIILPGVEIGEYSIIGAGSVITKDVPPYSLVVGIPGRRVKDTRDFLEKWKQHQTISNKKTFYIDWGMSLKEFCEKYPRMSREHGSTVINIIQNNFKRFIDEK